MKLIYSNKGLNILTTDASGNISVGGEGSGNGRGGSNMISVQAAAGGLQQEYVTLEGANQEQLQQLGFQPPNPVTLVV